MRKLGIICASVLLGMTLTACGNQSNKNTSSSSSSSGKVVQHKKHTQNKKKQSQASSASVSSSNSGSQSSAQQSNTTQIVNSNGGKSQSEINRERGYDPNGAPLLPGQDHAAGSNPDGSPDAWVQGQDEWAIQNGYMNPDGTNTAKGQAAEDEVARDSQPGMP